METEGKEKYREVSAKAAKILNEKGYHGTSMQDIANAVGIQKGSLYYYVAGKQDLLRDIIMSGLEVYESGMEEIVLSPDPPEEKLKKAIIHHLLPLEEYHDAASVFLKEVRNLDDESRKTVHRAIRSYHVYWEKILEEGIEKGRFSEGMNVKLTSFLIIGMCNSIERWYRADGELTIEQIGDIAGSTIINGLLRKG
ncbi:MAG: TetR/AcrR family transcriptional regulator [Actinobacteria bacterium]|nr:TetR/AcrR family transcriptional regulator [Actinomycetota bacterium]